MGVTSGCGEQEVGVASGSGLNLWVWLLGVVVRRYIDFLILLIPYSSCICSFLQQHHYFLFIFVNVFLEEELEEERRRMPNGDFYFARCVRKIVLYSAHSIGNHP